MDLDVLRGLADRVRLQIVELLRERPRSVIEVAAALGLRRPQTSKHLRTLADAGLLEAGDDAEGTTS
jgi:DNA-binding transcriptional ArsR family regulator